MFKQRVEAPMTVAEILALLLATGAAGLILYAAASDIARMTIPNWVSIAAAALFPPAAFLAGMPLHEIGLHIACGILVLAVGFGLFHLRVLGGGDVKVFTATAMWTGFSSLGAFLTITFIAGGALALVMLGLRRLVAPGPALPAFFNRLMDKTRGVPYAVAIAAGALITCLSWPISRLVLA
jgi:prepilin peptidase CpaA